MSVDPLADSYLAISPYAYVANNPLSFIDPTGAIIEPAGDEEAQAYEEYRALIDSKVEKFYAKAKRKGWTASKTKRKASNNSYVGIQNELNELENSKDVFRIRMGDNISNLAGGGNFSYNNSTKEIDVNIKPGGDFSEMQKLSHELKHAYQYLNGELGFDLRNGSPILHDRADERAAYFRQNLFSNGRSGYVNNVIDLVNRRYGFLPYKAMGVKDLSAQSLRNYKKKVSWGMAKLKFRHE